MGIVYRYVNLGIAYTILFDQFWFNFQLNFPFSASIVVMLKGIAVPMCRAYLACLVPSCEIGKIYSMTTSMESLAPIGAAPMYTLIYNYTLDKYPGAFNFFSAIIYLYCILLITYVYIVYTLPPEIGSNVHQIFYSIFPLSFFFALHLDWFIWFEGEDNRPRPINNSIVNENCLCFV